MGKFIAKEGSGWLHTGKTSIGVGITQTVVLYILYYR